MRNLITKIPEPRTRPEILFNESQIRTRNVVERSYGVWKRRFPVLANGLRVSYLMLFQILSFILIYDQLLFNNIIHTPLEYIAII